jgi:hypothetical protein
MSWICNVFLTFYNVCGLSRWHSILLPTQAHHILTCVFVCTWKNITPLPTCMDACCSSGIWVKSCLKWFLTSWQYFVLIRRFAFLVCHLTKLEIWPSVLFALLNNCHNVMTIIQDFMHDNYSFFCIWCEAHQFDLVMEHIMNEVVKNIFSQ